MTSPQPDELDEPDDGASPPEPDEPRVDEDGGAVVPDGVGDRGDADRSADDTDTGWGETPRPDGDHESWLREQRPPHWA